MRPWLTTGLAVSLVGIVAGCSQPRDIVFAASANGSVDFRTFEIFTMRPDGSEVRQLTHGADGTMSGFSNFPVWSPDGQEIAYLRDGAVRVMDKGGNNDRVVAQPSDVSAAYAEWSPDGDKILFAVADMSVRAVTGFYLVTLDDGSINKVPLELGRYGGGNWHPDGLSFYTERRPAEGPTTIIRVQLASGEVESILTSDSLYFEGAAISPDGETLLVQGGTFDPPSAHVYVMAPNGSGLRALTPMSGLQNNPRWSHDGTHVVMQCRFEGDDPDELDPFDVCTVALSGSNFRRVTHNSYLDVHPDW